MGQSTARVGGTTEPGDPDRQEPNRTARRGPEGALRGPTAVTGTAGTRRGYPGNGARRGCAGGGGGSGAGPARRGTGRQDGVYGSREAADPQSGQGGRAAAGDGLRGGRRRRSGARRGTARGEAWLGPGPGSARRLRPEALLVVTGGCGCALEGGNVNRAFAS